MGSSAATVCKKLFQSTPPGWEATVKMDTPFHDMERIFILVINRTALY